ncbi:type I polyketide synthase [Corallococcus sp. Z5C101001]|uniref:type I polyketide synthase n=1 Tax=Corallococcus sp. Z5C101001 TaxID=2596829 RepID=UPI0011801469|nr:type I polyketide synthase [Corallococcus sp. Z5C101001]TSC24493.1 SDR family NAD(P)-dependent oxidoreductase [Corallococcus sp. Z5C101001]
MSSLTQRISQMSPLKLAFAARELRSKSALLNAEPIAITGAACRLPGARDLDSFWGLLRDKRDAIREVPADRWDIDAWYDPDPDAPGKMSSRHGGFLERVDGFDPQFFGITPREAVSLDPQQRLLLEVTWEALEHAGQAPSRLFKSQTGVFVGIGNSEYAQRLLGTQDASRIDAYLSTGNALSVAAGRLSYTLGLVGPCMAVDTACSSALVTVHLACQSLRSGECSLALAGGVNLLLSPQLFVNFSRARMLAPDGRCKPFDAAANGYVRSEGCVMVVLKRLSDALADGSPILALIRGSAVNQDGPSGGITVPSGPAQQAVIRGALESGGVDPSQVRFVETHGTGTSLGDPIEAGALGAVFGASHTRNRPLVIGSVKSNVGHLENAAGIAGLLKVVLALKHEALPPSLHFQRPSPHIPWEQLPLDVATELLPWPSGQGRRLAGVSSFGFSGTNVHVVLEEAPSPDAIPARPVELSTGGEPTQERPAHLLPLSARTEPALRELARSYAAHLGAHPDLPLADVCYSAGTGRSQFAHRLAITAATSAEAQEALSAFSEGREAASAVAADGATPPKVAFLFTGQGSQYARMGRQLYDTEPAFRRTVDECEALLHPHLGAPLLPVLFAEGAEASRLDETRFTQPALFVLEYAMASLLRSWGIEPAFVMGHSVGEYAAACLAGVFSLEDGLKLIAARARLMQALPRDGAMVSVTASVQRVQSALRAVADRVSVASLNGSDSTVISGHAESVRQVAFALQAEGVRVTPLNVSHAFHSPLMEPMLADFAQVARQVRYAAPRLGWVSNLTGALHPAAPPSPDDWVRQVREPVRFAAGMETLEKLGCDTFVEIGPRPTLLGLGRACLPDSRHHWLPTLRQGQPEGPALLRAVGELYARGASVDWAAVESRAPRKRVTLPAYPFQRQRYWLDLPEQPTHGAGPSTGGPALHPLLHRALRSPLVKEIGFESRLGTDTLPFMDDHRIHGIVVVPSASHVSMLVAATELAFGATSCTLRDVLFPQALALPDSGQRTVQVVLTPGAGGEASFKLLSLRGDSLERDETFSVHTTGSLSWPDRGAAGLLERASLEEVRARCGEEISGAGFYEVMGQHQARLGERFQVIQSLRRGNEEAVCELRLPSALGDVRDHQLHPVLLDGCFQILGGMIPGGNEGTYVPFGLERFRFLARPVGERFWCHARMRRGQQGTSVFLDVRLLGEAGEEIAVIEGLQYQQASLGALERALRPSHADWLYAPTWEPRPLAPAARKAPALAPDQAWLVFTSEGALGDGLIRSVKERGGHGIRVSAGASYARLDGAHFQLDPSRPEDFARLFEALSVEGKAVAGIVHLWSLTAAPVREEATDALAALERAQQLGCGSVLHLIQALAQAGLARAPRLWLVTRGTQPAGGHPLPLNAEHAPLWGLGRVIAIEHPELSCVRVDLPPSESAGDVPALLEALEATDGEDQLAYREGARFVARLTAHRATPPPREVAVHAQASYLVTGGLGALGLEVAKWLVTKGARHLVLLGRNPPSSHATTTLQALDQQGARVHVVAADVSRADELSGALASLPSGMPPLAGVVHAAGVLEDGVLVRQGWERFSRVLAPKTAGAWNLHVLTRGLSLDFFVCFSSAASLLGAPGQGNYAAANAFLDALAHRRRALGLPALSINWGPWSGVGMAATGAQRRAASDWLGTLAPEQGLQVLTGLLEEDTPQVGVLPATWSRLEARPGAAPFLERFTREKSPPAAPVPLILRQFESAAPGARKTVLERQTKALVARVLGLRADDLGPRQRFFDLGADSLMAVELKNQLETQVGRTLRSTLIFDFPTLDALVEHLLAELSGAVPEVAPAPPRGESEHAARPEELEELSQDELANLLSQKIASLQRGRAP